jgi:hypothetical protein
MSRRSTLVRAGIVVVSVLVLGSQLAAQTLSPPVPPRDTTPPVRRVPVGTGIITGIVIAADTGRPLRNARVMLNGSVGSGSSAGLAAPGAPIQSFMMPVSRFAVTNEQGQFVFQRLPAGQFNMSVSRNQFLTTNYGERADCGCRRPAGQSYGADDARRCDHRHDHRRGRRAFEQRAGAGSAVLADHRGPAIAEQRFCVDR